MPFLSALAYSERYAEERGKRHTKVTDRAWQLLLLVRRWHSEREIVTVADSTYASLRLLGRCRSLSNPIAFITHLSWTPPSTNRPRHDVSVRCEGPA